MFFASGIWNNFAIKIDYVFQRIHKFLLKQNAASNLLFEFLSFFSASYVFYCGLWTFNLACFFLAIGCPLSDSKKGFRMIITAGARKEEPRWSTQTREMKTTIEKLILVWSWRVSRFRLKCEVRRFYCLIASNPQINLGTECHDRLWTITMIMTERFKHYLFAHLTPCGLSEKVH